MRADIQTLSDEIQQAVGLLRRRLDWDTAQKRLDELTAMSEAPDFWNNSQKAQALMRERTRLDDAMTVIQDAEVELSDTLELVELAEMEDDESIVEDAVESLKALQDKMKRAELEALLSGEADGNDSYLEIHSGAGGTESQDWASMMTRMYTRWANARGFKVEVIEEQAGEEAGLKSATLLIKGENAYGWLKTETGVHRLVRISPFDSSARRHTSFASVGAYPLIDDQIEVDIEEGKVRTDTYRASGAGGQHVNTTDSAVRLTYDMPGQERPIVVQCQNERSQHKNRAQAWDMLRARVYEIQLAEREAAAQAEADAKTEIGWGHQIRSYVLQPYQMVKDLRTNVETSNTGGVLDGDLDPFMAAALAARVGGEEEEA
ncbi:MAG: peptide chain release factor 2 [Maricaulis sp.]|uniref:peptide chain release factor 2 n=1 Tax=Maricaulis sp. TaxID=1486257 RepID=UPI001B2B1E13|nr:peptide chain release factor 2 [Maricaulis sp.]MBO6729852.1 peptide chain release factor 2 [Maricaulis sp.]MBO6848508.1 peptide chain release factor 2 [Maricaulis sp.]MBO6878092.1 peptide chain release factor 2 [Maricaulis sp.]